MSRIRGYFCDKCDDYCDIVFKERKRKYEYKCKEVVLTERQATCKNCESEVYDEEAGNETLRKISKD